MDKDLLEYLKSNEDYRFDENRGLWIGEFHQVSRFSTVVNYFKIKGSTLRVDSREEDLFYTALTIKIDSVDFLKDLEKDFS